MKTPRINENFHIYLSIGYLISLLTVVIVMTLEYSTIKNDINNLDKNFHRLENRFYEDMARMEHITSENSKSRSKQILSIKKYLKLCYNKKNHKHVDFNSLYEDIEDLELEISTLK